MSEKFRGFLTDDLAPMVARIQADYEAYLSSLPEYVAQAVIKFAPPRGLCVHWSPLGNGFALLGGKGIRR